MGHTSLAKPGPLGITLGRGADLALWRCILRQQYNPSAKTLICSARLGNLNSKLEYAMPLCGDRNSVSSHDRRDMVGVLSVNGELLRSEAQRATHEILSHVVYAAPAGQGPVIVFQVHIYAKWMHNYEEVLGTLPIALIVEKLPATELSEHIGGEDQKSCSKSSFFSLPSPLVAVITFSTMLHGRSIPVQLIHAKHLNLCRLERPSKCSPMYATASLAYTLSIADLAVENSRDCITNLRSI